MRTFIQHSILYLLSNKKAILILITILFLIYNYPDLKSGFIDGWIDK